jgi:hypothetical protein
LRNENTDVGKGKNGENSKNEDGLKNKRGKGK